MKKLTTERLPELKAIHYERLTTGIYHFDKQNGFGMNDFCVLAGASGSGKSTFALFMAASIAKSGKKVLYYNTEVLEKEIPEVLEFLGFDLEKDFGNNFERLHLHSVKKGLEFEGIEQAVILYQPDALFIDLFNALLRTIPFNMQNEYTMNYAEEFSFFPEKYKCAVFVTEQLIKNPTRYKRPNMDDIKGGASLTQKATKVITFYRHKKEQLFQVIKNPTAAPPIADIVTEVIVCKERYRNGLKNEIILLKLGFGGYKDLNTKELMDYLNYRDGK